MNNREQLVKLFRENTIIPLRHITNGRKFLMEVMTNRLSDVERLVPSGVFHGMHAMILSDDRVYRLSSSYKQPTMASICTPDRYSSAVKWSTDTKQGDKKYMKKKQVVLKIVPKRIIFGGKKVVVVFWPDGEKMVTKVSGGDQWDPEIGVLVCYYRRLMERTRKEAGKDFRWIKDELLKDYLMDVVVRELGLKRDACKRGGQNEKHLRFITGLVQEHMGKQ